MKFKCNSRSAEYKPWKKASRIMSSPSGLPALLSRDTTSHHPSSPPRLAEGRTWRTCLREMLWGKVIEDLEKPKVWILKKDN